MYDAALRSELASRLGREWLPVPEGAGQAHLFGPDEIDAWLDIKRVPCQSRAS